MSPRPILCLILACASGPLLAHECKRLAADSGGGGTAYASADAHGDEDRSVPADPIAKPAPMRPAAKPAKAPPAVRSSGDGIGEIRPPRWHSFLPGMFR